MTSTHEQATARLRDLREALENGTWRPSRPERTCAAAILDAPAKTPPVDAVLEGMRTAGPAISPTGEANLFATALVRSATLLRSEGFRSSKEGQQLLADMRALFEEVTDRVPLQPPWASRIG